MQAAPAPPERANSLVSLQRDRTGTATALTRPTTHIFDARTAKARPGRPTDHDAIRTSALVFRRRGDGYINRSAAAAPRSAPSRQPSEPHSRRHRHGDVISALARRVLPRRVMWLCGRRGWTQALAGTQSPACSPIPRPSGRAIAVLVAAGGPAECVTSEESPLTWRRLMLATAAEALSPPQKLVCRWKSADSTKVVFLR